MNLDTIKYGEMIRETFNRAIKPASTPAAFHRSIVGLLYSKIIFSLQNSSTHVSFSTVEELKNIIMHKCALERERILGASEYLSMSGFDDTTNSVVPT